MLRFDEFVDERLYSADHGFYELGGQAGRARGDFVTSVEVGPLFSVLIGRWLDLVWADLGEPAPFIVAEAGAGRGALAAGVLAARPRCSAALRYLTIERSAALRASQQELLDERVRSLAALEQLDDAHVVLANELLDNLAPRVLQRRAGGWDEVWMDGSAERLIALAGDPLADGGIDASEIPVGARVPWVEQATAWVQAALERVATGRVLLIDYGTATTVELVGRPFIRTYRNHTVGHRVGPDTNAVDITVDVPFDQLPRGAALATQAAWLERLGIGALVEEGRRVWTERAHVGDLAAVRARSRVGEAEALCDPKGLGGFIVAEWARGAPR